ncbi:hypothetical protein ACNUDN_02616 [Mycobacterium sp. smrl_JER01]
MVGGADRADMVGGADRADMVGGADRADMVGGADRADMVVAGLRSPDALYANAIAFLPLRGRAII